MKVAISLHDEFNRQFKRLAKKYKSIGDLVSDDADVTLLTIYDKEEIDNVTGSYIKWLVSEAKK